VNRRYNTAARPLEHAKGGEGYKIRDSEKGLDYCRGLFLCPVTAAPYRRSGSILQPKLVFITF